MSITMVNGHACANCSEISQAKRGENPHQSVVEKGQIEAAQAKEAAGLNASLPTSARLPNAVSAATESERPRAKLDFSQFLDQLA